MKPPKKWKTALLIWLAIYPAVTLLFLLFGSEIAQIEPLPLRTLVLTLVLVPLMVFVLIPLLQKLLKNWLQR